jgi:toxin-antitoxin system PIN domain toxin
VRALLDVNVLIALFDEAHVHFERAWRWWSADMGDGWASCPLTQNGFLRVVSQPSYRNPVPLTFAREFLDRQVAETDHAFWPDDISLLDPARFDRRLNLGPRQLTDVYLLGLAVKNNGRLATLDRGIPTRAVRDAGSESLVVI